jgi:hypothetical protein
VTTVAGRGFSLDDPAVALLSGGLAKDARTLSACMRVQYIGAMQSSAGQIALIENLPVEELSTDITVDELFRLSTKVDRMGVGMHEVKFRPSQISERFRHLPNSAAATNTERIIETGIAATALTRFQSNNQGYRCFGFAWRGTDSATALAIEFIKNIEWRPASDAGLPLTRPVAMYASPPIYEAERALDHSSNGNWSIDNVVSGAGHLAVEAFTGVAGELLPTLKRAVKNKAVSYLAGALPLLL